MSQPQGGPSLGWGTGTSRQSRASPHTPRAAEEYMPSAKGRSGHTAGKAPPPGGGRTQNGSQCAWKGSFLNSRKPKSAAPHTPLRAANSLFTLIAVTSAGGPSSVPAGTDSWVISVCVRLFKKHTHFCYLVSKMVEGMGCDL